MGYCIMCPFYISDKKLTISCEDSMHIFYDPEDKKRWIDIYCRCDWRSCEFAQKLNGIYKQEEQMSDWMKRAKLAEQKERSARTELKKLNCEYGKRVAELNSALEAKEAARKAAEHIVLAKNKQIDSLKENIEGCKQIFEIKDAVTACLMNDLGVTTFDMERVRQLRDKYNYCLTGTTEGPKLLKLHIEEK